jgi:hypothetical protein
MTTDENKLYRYNGSSWDATGDGIGTTIGRGTSFPGSPATNDLFIRTDEKKLYRYTGSAWDATGDGVGTTINSGTSFPGSPTTGDLFIRTDQDKLYRYTGSAWNATGDGTGSAASAIAHGTSFPGSPTTNDQFIRDDLNTLSRYDGAAWQTIGGTTVLGYANQNAVSGNTTGMAFTVIASLSATDYVELVAQQTSGGNLDVYRESQWTPRILDDENRLIQARQRWKAENKCFYGGIKPIKFK